MICSAQHHWKMKRGGFSLLELLAVVAIMGLLGIMAAARMTHETTGNLGSSVDARRIAFDLTQARRRAIHTGDNHFLQFITSGSDVTGYIVRQRVSGGGTSDVDIQYDFPPHITVTAPPTSPEFNFEGEGLTSYTITLAGPDRTWQVVVTQATGSVAVSEQ